MQQSNRNSLVGSVIAELEKAIELALSIPARVYREREGERASVGAHIRHNLDVINALVRGVRVGAVDYAERERDPRVEKDQRYAVWSIRMAIRSLTELASVDPGVLLNVRSEACPHVRHRSSLSRELEFVLSHTVHHHALINERIVIHGTPGPDGFGISPSTRSYREAVRTAA